MNNQPWTQWTGKKVMLHMRACYRCNTFFEVSEPSKKFCDYCSEYMMKNDFIPVNGSVGLNIRRPKDTYKPDWINSDPRQGW